MSSQRSYDDIVRSTVPLPDSSHRPQTSEVATAEQRGQGPNVRARYPDDETPLLDAVRQALLAMQGADIADLDLTIEGGRVQIDGSVADDGDRDRIVRAVSDVPGVIAVIDTIRVRAH